MMLMMPYYLQSWWLEPIKLKKKNPQDHDFQVGFIFVFPVVHLDTSQCTFVASCPLIISISSTNCQRLKMLKILFPVKSSANSLHKLDDCFLVYRK